MSSIDKTFEDSENEGGPTKYHFFEDSLINLQACKEDLRNAFEKRNESNKDFESEEENKVFLREVFRILGVQEKQVDLNYEKIMLEINIQKEMKGDVCFEDFFGIFENWFESEIFPSQNESPSETKKDFGEREAKKKKKAKLTKKNKSKTKSSEKDEAGNATVDDAKEVVENEEENESKAKTEEENEYENENDFENENEEEVQLETVKISKNAASSLSENEQVNSKAEESLSLQNGDIAIGLFKENKSLHSEKNTERSEVKVLSEGASIRNSFKTQEDFSRSATSNGVSGEKLEASTVSVRESMANLWDLIVEENSSIVKELYESFCVPFVHESQPEGLKDRRLGFQNIYLFFREIFYSDNGLTLYMDRYEEIDFFSQENSFKGFLKETTKIVRDLKGAELTEESIKDMVFSLEETLKIIKAWLLKQKSARIIRDQSLIREKSKPNLNPSQADTSDLKSILLQTIEKYKLMLDKSNDEKSAQHIKSTLETLKKQLESVGKKTRKPNEKITSAPGVITEAKDKRERALMEIFTFYCREKAALKVQTFEQVSYEKNVMNISKFFLFVKEFKMSNKNLNAQKLVELFRKTVDNQHPELNYSQFRTILLKMIPLVKGYEQPEKKTEEEIKEDLFSYMELEDPNKFRGKMQMFIPPQQTPVDSQKKKVVPFNLTKSPARSPDNPKDDSQTKKQKPEATKQPSQKKTSGEGKETYQKIQEKYIMEKKSNNEKNMDDEEFEPAKFFDLQNEKEDNLYLAEYDLDSEKQKKEKILEEGKKVLSDYGKPKAQEKPRVIPAQKFTKKEKSEGGSPNLNTNNGKQVAQIVPFVKPKEEEGRLRFDTSPNERKIVKAASSNMRADTSPFERDDYLKKQKVENMKTNIIARANELDKATKIKEQRQIKTLIENQENNIKKGLKVAHNKK